MGKYTADDYELNRDDLEEIIKELEEEGIGVEDDSYDKSQDEIDADNERMRNMEDAEIDADEFDGETYDLENDELSNEDEDLLNDPELLDYVHEQAKLADESGFGDEEEQESEDDPDDVRNLEVDEEIDVVIADDLSDEEATEDLEDYAPPVGAEHNEVNPLESCQRAEAAAKKYRESIQYHQPFSQMQNVVSGPGRQIKLTDEERDRLKVFANLKENDRTKCKHLIHEEERDYDAFKIKRLPDYTSLTK